MKEHEDNISYIDVANVLDLGLEGQYIDPSIASGYDHKQHNDDKEGSSSSSKTDSIRVDVPGVPQLPADTDPKKMCPFCQHTFSHPGSLGRHLDLKKGTQDHPADVIAQMRAQVQRRGDKKAVLKRRRERARVYNAREDVRERTRVQRRARDRVLRAKKTAMAKFTAQLGRPQLQPHPTFARLVLYFLPPDKWPHDPPTLETHRLLCDHLNEMFFSKEIEGDQLLFENIMTKVTPASENWLSLEDSVKQEIWIRELRRAAEDALNNTSLYQLKNRYEWIASEARRAISNNEDSHEEDDDRESIDTQQENQRQQEHHTSPSQSQLQQPQNTTPVAVARAPRNIMIKSRKRLQQGDKPSIEHMFNQEDLAAVAEAVVNNSNNDNMKNSHLDPQLMTR